MISRSTILALVFACFATLSLAGVAKVQRVIATESATPSTMTIYQMPRVVVSGGIQRSTSEPKTGN